jgi:hypothetical protein
MAPKFNPNADYSAAQFDPNADYSAADSAASTSPAPPGGWRKLTERERFEMTYPVGVKGEGVGENVKNIANNVGVGMWQTIAHPIKTAESMAASITPGLTELNAYRKAHGLPVSAEDEQFAATPNPLKGTYQMLTRGHAGEQIPQAVGSAIVMGRVVPSIEGALDLAPRAARGAADAVAGTGPRVTKALVKDTQAANVADAAKVGDANSIAALKAEATRRAELSKHNADVATHEANKAASNTKLQKDLSAQREIALTEQRVADAKSARLAAVETAREDALKVGNEQYTTVREALNPIEARPGFANDLDVLATQNIPGSKGAPTILKAIAKRAASQEPIRYEDLQADYSTLGNELSKGTLDGPTFHAYNEIHEAIGNEMQSIADSEGEPLDTTKVPRKIVDGKPTDYPAYRTTMGKQLYDARNYWRRMKQTFGKTKIINDAATKAIGGAKDEAQENQMRLLGSFDPQIPQLHSLVQTLEARAKSLPKPVPERVLMRNVAESRTAPPKLKLTPPEPPKLPAPRKIGPEDVRAAKAEAVANRADTFRNRGGGLASTFLVLDGIRNAFHGNVAAIGEDIGARAAFGVAKQSAARLLENPKVANWLSQATPRDVAQIPPDLLGDFPNLVKAAQAKGIKVSPALLSIAAVSGLPAPRAKHPTDVYQDMEP